ncbi:BnaC07g12490D [Brassica napus]|uniref:BnaC07g12490D protein n=1 Tax=Brassica napus TaxID=3708 RepID=A0A078G6I8_BRANA|nr:BnaC07g12490D [Brassica napus]
MVAGWEVIGGSETFLVSVMAEVDRILRPQGTFIIWRRSDLCSEVMVASYRGRDHYIGDSK